MMKLIFEMASVDFIKTADDVGYMEGLYKKNDFDSLYTAIKTLCERLTQNLFDDSRHLETSRWIKKAHSSEYSWLFSFATIREKIHELANVEQRHVNVEEAEKLLHRLELQ